MITSGPTRLRALRASVFAATVLLLAAAAHLAAGGALPGPVTLLVVGIPVACASVVLARRTRGLPSLLAALAIGQAVLHETFMTTTSSACAPLHLGAATGPHHPVAVSCDAGAAMGMTHAAPSVLMVALHVVATIATALLLTHGERVATRLAVWAADRLAPPTPATVVALPQPPLLTRTATPVVPLRAATDVSRRGPPASRLLPVHVTA